MLRWFLYPIVGGIAGYLYYRLLGCASGSCPLTSNPVATVLFGVFMGLALAVR
ncbi:MAG: DUF6132 family protein [Bacteroidota bacterium]